MISKERYERAIRIIERYERQQSKRNWSIYTDIYLQNKYEFYYQSMINDYKVGLFNRYCCKKVECLRIKKELLSRGVSI